MKQSRMAVGRKYGASGTPVTLSFLTKYRNSGHCEKLVVDKEIFADAKALFLIASNVNAPVPAMTALL